MGRWKLRAIVEPRPIGVGVMARPCSGARIVLMAGVGRGEDVGPLMGLGWPLAGVGGRRVGIATARRTAVVGLPAHPSKFVN